VVPSKKTRTDPANKTKITAVIILIMAALLFSE
jgi:hypothetical protein